MDERKRLGERNDQGKGEVAPNRELDSKDLARLATEQFEAIREYLQARAARREVVTQTVTRSGQELDWIPLESQAPDGRLAAPPSENRLDLLDLDREKPADGKEYRPHELLRFELTEADAALGPKGTVPVVRKPIERIHPTGTLQDYLSKSGRAVRVLPDDDPQEFAPPADQTVHQYAYSAQYVTCYGGEAPLTRGTHM